MSRKRDKRSILCPVFAVFFLAVISYAGYFSSRHVENDNLHQAMAAVFGTAYFFSIAFGAVYIYTSAYVKDLTMKWRILASIVTPFMWMTKEVFRLTQSHPVIECLYWYFNPLNIWLVSLVILEMGISTLLARSILSRRGRDIKVVTIAPVAVVFGSLSFVISAYAWGQGENIYVIFLEGYRVFFGSGI